MAKIALIGAGSVVFARRFLHDLFQVDALRGSTFALMAPTPHKIDRVLAYARRLVDKNGIDMRLYATTDRRDALDGADYVLLTIRIGGAEASGVDKEAPRSYGVDQAIGDTMGPGGVFRAQRTIPVVLDIARDMERLCPRAILLNYTNPMAMVCLALGRESSVRSVGLCHGIQTTLGLVASFTGVPKERIEFLCAGINHMAWFLRIAEAGRDLYPILRKNIERPEYYLSDKVRCEVMRHFGYFMTESTEHLSEYLPWFRKSKDLRDTYLDRTSYGMSRPELRNEEARRLAASPLDLLDLETGDLEPRSAEYCSHIIEALETGRPFRFNGNVMNRGFIENLPTDCCVEVPIAAGKGGLAPESVGSLPPRLAVLNMTNVGVQQLAAEAAVTGDPETLFAAVAMDPLTSAVLSLEETCRMVGEMLEAEREWLPQYEGRDLPRRDPIRIPSGTQAVPTPIDPALATIHRIAAMFPEERS
jgi:alpha-galactosidase